MTALPKYFQLPMVNRLLDAWIGMPRVIDEGIASDMVAREPRSGWVPLKGLSPISDLFPPEAYANPGFAQSYNKAIRKFRRREALSAFIAGISKQDLEARLDSFVWWAAFFERQQDAKTVADVPPTTSN